MTPVTALDSLRHLSALSHFSLEQFETLARAAEVLNVQADHIVIAHGAEGPHLFGLIKGGLTVQRGTPQGDFVLARLRPGDLLGEASFLEQPPRSSEVVAASDSELIQFDAEKLYELCADDRLFEVALYWAMWNSMSRKLRITTQMLSHFFAGQEAGAFPTTVGSPQTGDPFDVSVRSKRDLFLEKQLSHLEANFLASLSKAERFPAGETIFREGDVGEKLYFVIEGEVRISKTIPGAGEEALAIIPRGEVFGEMALVDGRPRTADAVAHEGDVEVLAVPASVMARLLDIERLSSAALLKMLSRTLAQRLRSLDEKIVGWFILTGGDSTIIGTGDRDLSQP